MKQAYITAAADLLALNLNEVSAEDAWYWLEEEDRATCEEEEDAWYALGAIIAELKGEPAAPAVEVEEVVKVEPHERRRPASKTTTRPPRPSR